MQVVEALLDRVRRSPAAKQVRTLDVRIGPFWTVVHTTVGAGMASTMANTARPHEGLPVTDAGRLHTRDPLELTTMLRSAAPTEAAVGLATVNALLGVPEGHVTQEKAVHILRDRCRNKRVAVIGQFPFAETLRPGCDRLWVFERSDRGGSDVHTEDEMPELLPRAEIVAITATTLLNGTLDDVLEHVAADAWTLMLGPSTPMSPALFEIGFDVLCGTVVDDIPTVVSAVTQGAVTKQISGVRRLSLWKSSRAD